MSEFCGLCSKILDDCCLPKKYITDCEHEFHINCIANWTKNNEICPICGSFINHNFSFYYKHLSRFWILLCVIIFLPCFFFVVIYHAPWLSSTHKLILWIIMTIVEIIFAICNHVREKEYNNS